VSTHVDSSQTQRATISTPDGDKSGWLIPVFIPDEDVASHLSEYDSTQGTHPLASQAKPIARAVLDELEAKAGGS